MCHLYLKTSFQKRRQFDQTYARYNLTVYTVSILNIIINVILLQACSHNIRWEIKDYNNTLTDLTDHTEFFFSARFSEGCLACICEVS